MSVQSSVTKSFDGVRALFDRAKAETSDQVAQFSGRGASWVDEAGRSLAEGAFTLAAQLTETAGEQATKTADRVAVAVGRWSEQLGDRMIRLGEQVARKRD